MRVPTWFSMNPCYGIHKLTVAKVPSTLSSAKGFCPPRKRLVLLSSVVAKPRILLDKDIQLADSVGSLTGESKTDLTGDDASVRPQPMEVVGPVATKAQKTRGKTA